jgi:hypothetical protein
MDTQLINKKNIDDIVSDILWKSRSVGVFPTPVDQIVAYCGLNIENINHFHKVPKNYIPKSVDAFTRMMGKILGAFNTEEKNIYIAPTLPAVKKAFVKLHETGHGVIPWQRAAQFEDDDYTLSPDVKELFEAEANYFASACLFQQGRFEDQMNKLPLAISSPIALATKFGGSNHAAFRHYAECSKNKCALLVLKKTDNGNVLELRNSFQSIPFTKDYGELSWPVAFGPKFPFVADYSRNRRLHLDGSILLKTANGLIDFDYHYFYNRYNVFVLLLPAGEKNRSKMRGITIPSPGSPLFSGPQRRN